MLKVSLNKLKQIAKMRGIEDYKSISEETVKIILMVQEQKRSKKILIN